ncbi:hypothetical protein EDD29_7698 [Actinocorallia herbida]|uniref:Uncharacterized protein n=1 Tax=Actinocorallia herbida TaxID=58109 RepID=A0A3N1D916_9ACTN|nr:hypothetical protein [Actinocorallia herbida]ROO89986.1 hypothetical protein EDD29_7698 [Actinocorallia herbida]
MGFYFSYADGAGPGFDVPGHVMADVREVLRIAVAHAGADCPVQVHKFESNDGWHVGPEECRAIADLLDGAEAEKAVSTYGTFVDGIPDGLVGEVRALGEFSAQAVERGGFHVS